MRRKLQRVLRAGLWAVLAMSLTGCFEAVLSFKLLDSGEAVMRIRFALTENMVKTANEIRALDPTQDLLAELPSKPTKDDLKTMKKAGVKMKVLQ